MREFTDKFNMLPFFLSERERLVRYLLEVGEKPAPKMLTELSILQQCITAFDAVCPDLVKAAQDQLSGDPPTDMKTFIG